METSGDWEKVSLTVKHIRKGRKNTKTLTFDLSHVVQPMQMQFVVTHDKQYLEEFLQKQGANLSDCSHEHIVLSLESSGTVDEVSVQATNLILHFLLEYDTKPFYLSEDEAEQKYEMKEEIRKVCQAFNVNVIWKEESNVIWLIGQLTAVKKCFLSLMTFCQGTSEKAQTISQATFVDWEKCKHSAQTAITESELDIASKEKLQQELLSVKDRHKSILEETGRKHKEELQRLTEEIQYMKKSEDVVEATKLKQEELEAAEARLAESQKENAYLKEKIDQLESDKHVENMIIAARAQSYNERVPLAFREIDYAEYRFVIKFLTLKGEKPERINERLCDVRKDSAPLNATVKRWVSEFKRGRQSIEDDPRFYTPVTSTSQEITDKVFFSLY